MLMKYLVLGILLKLCDCSWPCIDQYILENHLKQLALVFKGISVLIRLKMLRTSA